MPQLTRPSLAIEQATLDELAAVRAEAEALTPAVARLAERSRRVLRDLRTQRDRQVITEGTDWQEADGDLAYAMRSTGAEALYDVMNALADLALGAIPEFIEVGA